MTVIKYIAINLISLIASAWAGLFMTLLFVMPLSIQEALQKVSIEVNLMLGGFVLATIVAAYIGSFRLLKQLFFKSAA